MGFQNINKVEPAQIMLDRAFKKATKVSVKKGAPAGETQRTARAEAARLDVINENIHGIFARISKEFPAFDNLSEFYSELLRVTLDYDRLKQSLGAVHWADMKAKDLVIQHKKKMFGARSKEVIIKLRKAYMGRLSSVVEQVDKNLSYLEEARRVLREFPTIKQLPTVCIAGFPNVGKSTLLGKITTSKPEIKNYAFTTKSLNFGYYEHNNQKIQVIDTPGTLARPEKMNNIEKQAYLAIKYQGDVVVYVFDPTETYPFEQQEQLLEYMTQFRKKVLFYLSKTDIATEEQMNFFKKKYEVITTPEELKEKVSALLIDTVSVSSGQE